jgi:hypothetical protein
MLTFYTVPAATGQRASIPQEEGSLKRRLRHVDFAEGEQRSEEVLELDPLGRVPLLVDPETNLDVCGSVSVTAASRVPGRMRDGMCKALRCRVFRGRVSIARYKACCYLGRAKKDSTGRAPGPQPHKIRRRSSGMTRQTMKP